VRTPSTHPRPAGGRTPARVRALALTCRPAPPLAAPPRRPPLRSNSNTQHTNDGSKMQAAYESLFQQYGVSVVVAGHVHAYERSCPVFKGKCVADGEAARYFTSGDGGASLYTKWIAQPEWSEVRLAQWGHGEITLHNATWATWNWVRNADNEPDAYDSVDIKNVGL
jgi:hypothetical protein